MRFFGRSKKEQFENYTEQLEQAERKVFYGHLHEMIDLLERAEDAYDGSYGERSDSPRSMHNVQHEISKFLKRLDTEMLAYIMEHFVETRKGK